MLLLYNERSMSWCYYCTMSALCVDVTIVQWALYKLMLLLLLQLLADGVMTKQWNAKSLPCENEVKDDDNLAEFDGNF